MKRFRSVFYGRLRNEKQCQVIRKLHAVYQDLHERMDKTRDTDPLEDSAFQYGFNSTHLKKVVSYWRNEFDWKKQVDVLNKYPHFKTKIEGIQIFLGLHIDIYFSNISFFFNFNVGLDVHFIHVRPAKRQNQRVLPLMLVHGWPGSFFEFYRIMPLLTETQGEIVFEVICPSIPGYGFSEAPHKQGRFIETEFYFQL